MARLVYPEQCPDCGYTLSRSRRRGWIEKFLGHILKIAVFRCHRCGARFYSPPAVVVHALGSGKRHMSAPAPVSELALVRAESSTMQPSREQAD